MKTNELRSMIVSQLNNLRTGYGLNGIFYQIAQDEAMFPHIVFDFDNVRTMSDDRNRRDYKMIIDVFDKNNSTVLINNLADAIEELLDQKNLPQTGVLPTLFFESRRNIPDEDKMIKHIQIVLTIQNYERN